LGALKEKKVMLAVHIDERGRTTLPKQMLELLGIKPGGILVFSREGDGPFFVGKGELKVDIPFLQKSKAKRTSS
jgi:AbrB family looped-hinge helix DNA binding protein